MKLLLVEDEQMLARVLLKGLKKYGYVLDHAADGEEALAFYDVNAYDLVILDLNIPLIDGMEVLRHIRKSDLETRILILSARSDISDRVAGLDDGANDYLVKPFDFLELEARVRSLLRRSFVQENVVLRCGELVVDTAQKLVSVSGSTVELTKKEYTILEYLILRRGQVISSEELIEHVWDSNTDLFTNPLKFQMHSLKKKLSSYTESNAVIKNIRGQGYILMDGNKEE